MSAPKKPPFHSPPIDAHAPTRADDSAATIAASDPSHDETVASASNAFSPLTGESDLGAVNLSDDVAALLSASSRYEAGAVIGSGGMGEVRLQRDVRIGRQVAMKTLHRDTQHHVQRFLRETRVQGQLEHPAIVPVYDLDTGQDGQAYFTMKRIVGSTLSRIIDGLAHEDPELVEAYPQRKLLNAFVQVCQAVHYAHSRRVIHRDIKPANIMLGNFGEVYLLDWGIAKVVDSAAADDSKERSDPLGVSTVDAGSDDKLTSVDDFVGTAAYMPPEQARGLLDRLDARTDVYTLGAVLFEILTKRPFRDGENAMDMLAKAVSDDVPRPSDYADVPPELDAICLKATAPSQDDRFASAEELASAVDTYLAGDRDRDLRRSMAAKHLEEVRTRLASQPKDVAEAAATRSDAMRAVVRALALDADNAEAQRLLVELVIDVDAPMPPEAEQDYKNEEAAEFKRNARLGAVGYLSLLVGLPLSVFAGVRDWLVIGAVTFTCLLCSAQTLRLGSPTINRIAGMSVLGALNAVMLILTSGWLGPFIIVPTLAAMICVFHAMASTAAERRVFAVFLAIGSLAPYVIEYAGWFPPAFEFRDGTIVLFERVLGLGETATMTALIYVSSAFVVLTAFFVGKMRDSLKGTEKRIFLQAWNLRHLFPAGGKGS